MSEEKLTIGKVVCNTLNRIAELTEKEILTYDKVEIDIISLLEQIRDEIYEMEDNTYGGVKIGYVSRIFAKYLNEKGGK